MKKFVACMMALLLTMMMCGSAMASSVEYLNREDLFDFKPGSEYQATDLFEAFKEVVPGDVIDEYITVRNSSNGQIRIWLQCKYDSYVTTENKDFLSRLTLSVEASDQKIFEAPADQKAQLSGPVLLGTFRERGEIELKVTLHVPGDLGNEYMGQVGIIPWTFIVEEIPQDDTPDTGDWFQIEYWFAAAAGLMLVISMLLIVQRKRKAAAH